MVKNNAKLCLTGIAAIILLHFMSVGANAFAIFDAPDTFAIRKPNSTALHIGFIITSINPYKWPTVGEELSLNCIVWSRQVVPTFMKWEKIIDSQNINLNGSALETIRTPTLLQYVIKNYTTTDAGVYQCTAHLEDARPKIVTTYLQLSNYYD